jgi:hypothetical protein
VTEPPSFQFLLPLFINAAAWILMTCMAENPPALARQSRPGLALQKGQVRLIALVGSTLGIESLGFAMPCSMTDSTKD